MKTRMNGLCLWIAALCGLCGCDLPICDKGDMICGNRSSNGTDIVIAQHNQFSSNGDVNPQPCRIYNCVDDDFVELKSCEKGSRFEDGVLSCVPRCVENEIVCAKTDENSENGEMSIIGPERYLPFTDPETHEQYKVNDYPCALYRCINDEYIPAGTCGRGSIMSEQGVVSCISNCWNRPKLRCQEDDNGIGRVQRCDENHSTGWVDLLCDNSCKFTERGKITGTVYKEEGFEAGECGECRNDMDVYCNVDRTIAYKCVNGVITEAGGCPSTHDELCGDKYVDLTTDRTNCGGCYMHCGETESCSGGKCVEDGCNTTGYMRYPLDGMKIRAYCISSEEKLINVYNNLRQGKTYPAEDDEDPNEFNAYVFTNSVTFNGDWKPVSWDNKNLGITIIGHGNTLKIEKLITNETDDDSVIPYSGVFGKLNNARIVDLTVLASVEHHDAQISKSAGSLTSEEATNLSMGIEQGAGGVVGFLKNSTVSNVVFSGTVTGTKNVGGFAGIAEGNSKLSGVSVSGTVIADPYIGFDEILSPTESLKMTPEEEKCLLANDTYKTVIKEAFQHQANLGGLVGYLYNSSITNGYSDITVQSADNIPITNAGGLVGYMSGASDLISCHRNLGLDIAGTNIGGLVGSVYAPTLWTEPVIKDSYFAGFEKGGKFDENAATLPIHANLPFSQIKAFGDCGIESSADTYYPSQAVGGLVGEYSGLGVLKLIHAYVNTELTAYKNVGGMVGLASGNTRIDAFMEFIESFNYVEYMLQFYQFLRDSGFLDDLSTVDINDPKIRAFLEELKEFVGSPINRATIHANHNAGGLVGKSEKDLYIANINLVKDNILTSMVQLFLLLQNQTVTSEEQVNAEITKLIESTMTEIGTEKRYPIYISLDQDREKLAQQHLVNHMQDPVYSAAGGLVGVTGGAQITVDNPNATPPMLSITNTFTAETIYGDKDVGGFIGVNHSNANAMLFFTFADLSANKNVGGIIGSDDAQMLLLTNAYDDSGEVTIFQDYYLNAVKIAANPNVAGGDGVIENLGGLIGLASGISTGVLNTTIKRLELDVAGANVGGVIGNAKNTSNCNDIKVCPLAIRNVALDNSEILISGSENIGGLIGYTDRPTALDMNGVRNATIRQRDDSSAETGVGGLVGAASLQQKLKVMINNCYSSALIKGHAAGGILGIGEGDGQLIINGSLVNVDVHGTKYSGAVAGLYNAPAKELKPNDISEEDFNAALSDSGFTGVVSIDNPDPTKKLYLGGLFGKCMMNALGINNSYLYVASNDIVAADNAAPKVMNNGALAGQIGDVTALASAIIVGQKFYYWGDYSNLYGKLSGAVDTMPLIGTPLLEKIEFSALDENGLFIVGSDKQKLSDKNAAIRRLDMSIYSLEGRKCQRVQYTDLLRTVKHNIGKQCR